MSIAPRCALGICLAFVAGVVSSAAGCSPGVVYEGDGTTGKSGSTDSDSLDELALELEQEGVDARALALGLADDKSDLDLLDLIPWPLRSRVERFLGSFGISTDESSSSPWGPRGNALVFIANGDANLWKRTLIEWGGRLAFAAPMRMHYRDVRYCMGTNGTASCWKSAATSLARDKTRRFDVVVMAHGFAGSFKGNDGSTIHADQAFTGATGRLRYGMFMPCYAAAPGPGGSPSLTDAFMGAGAVASYGAVGTSVPTSDIQFYSAFSFGTRFASAMAWSNSTYLDDWGRSWASGDNDDVTVKSVFGRNDAHVYDP